MSRNRLRYPDQHAKDTACSETPGEKASKAMPKKAYRKCCRTIASYRHSRRNGEKSFGESPEAKFTESICAQRCQGRPTALLTHGRWGKGTGTESIKLDGWSLLACAPSMRSMALCSSISK